LKIGITRNIIGGALLPAPLFFSAPPYNILSPLYP